MTWIKLDDSFPNHPKVIKAGPAAAWLYVSALCYSSSYLLDGYIESSSVEVLTNIKHYRKAVDALIEVGLWEEVEGGYQIHDYLEHQKSRASVQAEREKSRKRQTKHRAESRRDNTVSHVDVTEPDTDTEVDTDTDVTTSCPPPDGVEHRASSEILSLEIENPESGKQGPNGSDDFEAFWLNYPKRNGKRLGKAQALVQWRRMKPSERFQALTAVTNYFEACEAGTLAKDAERWLRDKRWVDWLEPAEIPRPISSSPRAGYDWRSEFQGVSA